MEPNTDSEPRRMQSNLKLVATCDHRGFHDENPNCKYYGCLPMVNTTHRFEFDSWIERFDREVDVRVVFNATPPRKATHLDPPEYVEIEDLALEATDTPDSATPEELERLMKDDTVMSIFKRDAYDWLEKNTQHQK